MSAGLEAVGMVFAKLRKFGKTLAELGKKAIGVKLRRKLGRKETDPKSVYDQLSSEDQSLAKLSQAAYGKKGERDAEVAGWTIDRDLSGDNAAVYTRDGTVSIAYRGTDPTNTSDLKADAYILTGKQKDSKRFREAEDLYKRARAKYGNSTFKLTGHSLGGSQASHVARKYADDGTTASVFNPGRGIDFSHMKNRALCAIGMGNKRKCKAVRTHAIRGDPISMLDQSNRTEYATSNINSHGLENFLPPA